MLINSVSPYGAQTLRFGQTNRTAAQNTITSLPEELRDIYQALIQVHHRPIRVQTKTPGKAPKDMPQTSRRPGAQREIRDLPSFLSRLAVDEAELAELEREPTPDDKRIRDINVLRASINQRRARLRRTEVDQNQVHLTAHDDPAATKKRRERPPLYLNRLCLRLVQLEAALQIQRVPTPQVEQLEETRKRVERLINGSPNAKAAQKRLARLRSKPEDPLEALREKQTKRNARAAREQKPRRRGDPLSGASKERAARLLKAEEEKELREANRQHREWLEKKWG